mmetsp:Transcript_36512/g.46866  ORF Transcript_36512/g.46866 Transcript_36512/m.46866 type:complete len:444 (+) Transcript_36512:81-1412(+)
MEESKMEIDQTGSPEVDSEETIAENKLQEILEEGDALDAQSKTDAALQKYQEILDSEYFYAQTDRVKEEAAYRTARCLACKGKFEDVMGLLTSLNSHFSRIPKARAAKIVRTVIDTVATVPNSNELQVNLCEKVVAWCREEKRTFLRQRIESRLAALLFEQGRYNEAQTLINRLLRELKKLDDKQMLVETHLVEARVHHALRNVPKAKAALTASRTAGNAIYIVPLLQGEIDQMAGSLHCEERDYKTAFSYFLEAYEAYDQNNDPRAPKMLQYMMMCKVLQGSASEVPAMLAGKWGIKHSGIELEAMAKVASAAKNRSLEDYDAAMAEHGEMLQKDVLICHHLDALYNQLLESNLLKVIEPFSCVEIVRVAQLMNLPVDKVERKISQMILDGKFLGILDQGRGQLIAYDEMPEDQAFANGLEVVSNMGSVVDSLFKRAQTLVR